MHLLDLKTRDGYQSVPSSSCRLVAGVCAEHVVILAFILIFVAGLSLLTLGLNLRARLRSIRQGRAAPSSPPPYSNIGFPLSASRDVSLHKAGLDSPSLDPYHVVAPSLDSSLLKDDYFTHVPHPDQILAPSRPAPSAHKLPSGVGLRFGSTVQTEPPAAAASPLLADGALTPPPPVYVQDPRRGEDV
ncbi:hypothetical protein C8R44DRAFT_870829 [Mycena epipterygia]|nr:hypothetical protein C8R44DRAFT_870829 [Mycena epipterygia]